MALPVGAPHRSPSALHLYLPSRTADRNKSGSKERGTLSRDNSGDGGGQDGADAYAHERDVSDMPPPPRRKISGGAAKNNVVWER